MSWTWCVPRIKSLRTGLQTQINVCFHLFACFVLGFFLRKAATWHSSPLEQPGVPTSPSPRSGPSFKVVTIKFWQEESCGVPRTPTGAQLPPHRDRGCSVRQRYASGACKRTISPRQHNRREVSRWPISSPGTSLPRPPSYLKGSHPGETRTLSERGCLRGLFF